MTITEAIISGTIQGVTEYLPVSSSGHLAILHKLFGFAKPEIFFNICLHIGTLLAILVYFRKVMADIIKTDVLKWAGYLVLATLPAALIAPLFEDQIERVFSSTRLIGISFFITALALLIGHLSISMKRTDPGPNFIRSLMVGLFQAVALLPGVSRSGITISAGLRMGMGKEEAFNFSFLIAVPAIFGALLYELMKSGNITALKGNVIEYTAGTLTAFIVGIFCLGFLKGIVLKSRMGYFGIYCFFLGLVCLFI